MRLKLPLSRNLAIVIVLVLIGCLTVIPVAMLLLGSVSKGLGAFGAFTVEKYVKAYSNPDLPRIVLNTAIFTVGAALLATTLALVLAYLSVRTNIPLKGMFRVVSIVPMMVPHILFAVGWMLLLNPSNGVLNVFLRTIFNTKATFFNIYTLPGMIFVEGLLDLPIAYLIISPAMSSFDPSLEEASKMSGAGTLNTLRKVTLPVLRPAILASFILVLIRSIAAFAVPSMIGMPGRIYVLATHIYRIVSIGYATDYGEAAAIGLLVLLTSIVFIYLYRHLTAEGGKYVTVSGKGYRPTMIDLGRFRYPLFAGVSLVLLVLIVLPVVTLLYTSLLPYSMVPSSRAVSMMSWNNWRAVLHDPISMRALKNSVLLGVGGATLGVLISVFVSYIIVKYKTRASGLLETFTFLSFSFPGIVIGVGFMWFFVRTPLYATIWALLIGYVATYLPYGVRPLTSAFIQIHQDLEEASRVCGGGFIYTLRRIVVPLLIPGIVSGWILMATMFLRELSLSVVLSRPGTEVLAVRILTFADDSLWGKVSALGTIMILISTVLVVLATAMGWKASRVRNIS